MIRSSDSLVARYEYILSLYKQKDSLDFIRRSYFLIDTALAYVFEYLNRSEIKASKIYEICGFPVIRYEKDNKVNLVLVLPMLNGEYIMGNEKGRRIKVDLDVLTDKYLSMIKGLNARAYMAIADYYNKSDTELVESIMSPFGRLYLPRGVVMTELKLRDVEEKGEAE